MEVTQKERHGVLFYSCDEMEQVGFAHGFSTRVGGVSPAPWDSLNLGAGRGDEPERVSENFRRFCHAIGADPDTLVKNHQIHSDVVRQVGWGDQVSFPGEGGQMEADGLITGEKGLSLCIFTADCIPVLLCDPVKRVACAVHAGWRGTALGIAARGVERMKKDYGCRGEDILAAIGPGISTCCFETHADVPDGLRDGMGERAKEFIHPIPENPEKYHVDLKGANRRWLMDAGVDPSHIAVCEVCTACRGDLFWSHRRLGVRRGSLATVIQIR